MQLRIDENRSDQCVNARTIYSKCHISNLTNSLKHETRDRASLLCEHAELAGYRICDILERIKVCFHSSFSELKHCMRSLITLVAG